MVSDNNNSAGIPSNEKGDDAEINEDDQLSFNTSIPYFTGKRAHSSEKSSFEDLNIYLVSLSYLSLINVLISDGSPLSTLYTTENLPNFPILICYLTMISMDRHT